MDKSFVLHMANLDLITCIPCRFPDSCQVLSLSTEPRVRPEYFWVWSKNKNKMFLNMKFEVLLTSVAIGQKQPEGSN